MLVYADNVYLVADSRGVLARRCLEVERALAGGGYKIGTAELLHNGFGCGVIEHLHDAGLKTPVARVGWPDEFVEHGSIPALRAKHGLTPEAAVKKILSHLGDSAATAGSEDKTTLSPALS